MSQAKSGILIDQEIIRLHGAGQQEQALRLFIDHYQGRLYTLAYQMLGNHDDAMDALQEIFLQINRSLESFRGQSGLYTWVYRLAANVCLNFRKKREKMCRDLLVDNSLTEQLMPIERPNEDPDKMCETKYKQFLVQQALLKLPNTQRVVLVLHDLEGFTVSEAAAILGIEPGAAKARLHRGRAALRKVVLQETTVKGMEGIGLAALDGFGELQ